MKKACIVFLCLGLMAASALLISWAGEKDALRRETERVKNSNTTLQTQWTKEKAEWEKTSEELKQQAEALRRENDDLTARLSDTNEKWLAASRQAQALSSREQQAVEALQKAKQEWNDQLRALSEQNEALSGKLENALTALLPLDGAEEDWFAFPQKEQDAAPAPLGRYTDKEIVTLQ